MLHDPVPAFGEGQACDLFEVAVGLDELAHAKGGALEVVALCLSPGLADLHFRRFISPIIDHCDNHHSSFFSSETIFLILANFTNLSIDLNATLVSSSSFL